MIFVAFLTPRIMRHATKRQQQYPHGPCRAIPLPRIHRAVPRFSLASRLRLNLQSAMRRPCRPDPHSRNRQRPSHVKSGRVTLQRALWTLADTLATGRLRHKPAIGLSEAAEQRPDAPKRQHRKTQQTGSTNAIPPPAIVVEHNSTKIGCSLVLALSNWTPRERATGIAQRSRGAGEPDALCTRVAVTTVSGASKPVSAPTKIQVVLDVISNGEATAPLK
jgi:hypothetical protein